MDSAKNIAMDTVKRLPEEATFEQIIEAIAIDASIRRGEEAADAGKVMSHEDVRRRLARWQTDTR